MQLFLNLFPVFFPVLIRHITRYAPHKNNWKSSKTFFIKSWNKFQTASEKVHPICKGVFYQYKKSYLCFQINEKYSYDNRQKTVDSDYE